MAYLEQRAEAGDKGNVDRGHVFAAQRAQPSQAWVHMLLVESHQICSAAFISSSGKLLLQPGLYKWPAKGTLKLK